MTTRIRVVTIDHYDSSIKGIAENKTELVNEALQDIEENGFTVLQITETSSGASYSVPGDGIRDYHYNESATFVTILYTDRRNL
jgi:hypothetical protein